MTNLLIPLLVLATLFTQNSSGVSKTVALGLNGTRDYSQQTVSLETKTNFTEKEIVEKEIIRHKTQYTKNPNLETDVERVIQAGANGERRNIYTVTSWQGKTVDKTFNRSEVTEPKDEIIEVGTKFSWREVSINGSTIRYWKKINVWATSYDANCKGCTGHTWAGTDVVLGTCAVDPKVIDLGTHFYVPGYGLCSALDIGGAIKGNKIDLGFPEVSKGFWSARYVDIYLLDGEPT